MVAATKDPLLLAVTDIATGWAMEHGADEGAAFAERLSTALDKDDLASVSDSLNAEQLTRLADAYQSAEANSRVQSQRTLQRLGSILGSFTRYAGRAFLVALVP